MASLQEAVRIALAWEEDARKNYSGWAQATDDPNAKRLFMNLAKMEARHARMLAGIRSIPDANLALKGSEWLDLSQGMTTYPTSGDRDLAKIFQYAISQEDEARARYLAMAKAVGGGEAAVFFTRLADEEEYHKTLINEQYSRLLKTH